MPGHSHYKRCAVPSCVTNNRVLKKCGVILRYFSFPKDKSLRNEWLLRCNKSCDDLAKNDTICSRHFHINDYEDGIQSTIINVKPKRLKSKAIPSLFLEKRPQELLQRNIFEYHKILAQEILNVEKQDLSKSSEPPIYLEFSRCENIVQQSKSPNSSIETDIARLSDDHNDLDPLEGTGDYSFMDVKEESIIKPYVNCEENCADKNESIKNNMDDNDFVGNCYVCDKSIRQRDIGQLSHEDFTKIVQRVLEGIAAEYVIVITKDDGLCGACRSLVARITKLEADLRTTSLGLRALLRLKYSLPPPAVEKKEHSKVQVQIQQSNISSRRTAAVAVATKDNVTQTVRTFFNYQRHKLTQTAPNTVVRKHKKTQTNDPTPQKKSKSEIKIVSSVNEVERLAAGDLEEKYSDWNRESQTNNPTPHNKSKSEIKIFSSVNEVECLKKGDFKEKYCDRNRESTVEKSAPSEGVNCMFEDISDATELTTLLNDNCLVAESEVVTVNRRQSDSLVEVKQPMKRKPVKTKINIGVLKCARCSFKTKSPDQMKTHMLSFINEEGFYCSLCDFAYHKRDHFRRHKIGHSEASKNKRCIFCDEVVHDELHMRFHIEAKHRPNPFTYRCTICKRVFMFAHTMRRHQRVRHSVMKIFSCEKCGKTFGDKVKYDSHAEYYHRDSLDCKYCKREYLSIEKLINHENSQHRFDRAQHYQCRYCPKRFVRQDLLPRHEERHTGQFEHRCDLCGCGFHEAASLKKHKGPCRVLMRAAESAESPQSLTLQALLRRRRRREPHGRHDSLVCDVCGKIIMTRQKYKLHREMHDSPDSFQCHLCGKKFRYKCNMGVHIKNLHMGADITE